MNKHPLYTTEGFVALTAVLVLSALFLSISIGIASKSIAGADSNTGFVSSLVAKVASDGCVEYALIELERTLYYVGEESLTFGDVVCDIGTISGAGPTDRIIEASSSAFAYAHKDEVAVSTVSPEVVVDYWLSVVEF